MILLHGRMGEIRVNARIILEKQLKDTEKVAFDDSTHTQSFIPSLQALNISFLALTYCHFKQLRCKMSSYFFFKSLLLYLLIINIRLIKQNYSLRYC